MIDKIIDNVIKVEGGYVNHPNDKGGETIYGITRNVAMANGYTGKMSVMPIEIARKIYKYVYFLKPKFDKIAVISEEVAEELFDTGVNMGTGVACKFLQQALNLLNQNGNLYPDLVVDGDFGVATIEALHKIKVKPNGIAVLLKVLNGLQLERYKAICEKNPTQEVFLWGWVLNRC